MTQILRVTTNYSEREKWKEEVGRESEREREKRDCIII